MKHPNHRFLISTLTLAATATGLTSSIVTNGGSGPSRLEPVAATLVTTEKKDITFSVCFDNDFEEEAPTAANKIADLIQRELEQSNLFSNVKLVTPEQAGPEHFEFQILQRGPSPDTRMLLGAIQFLSLTTLPVWMTADLDWKLTVHSAARAPYTLTSSQYARRTTWLPLLVAAPFFNVEDSAADITQRTVRYFLHETLNK